MLLKINLAVSFFLCIAIAFLVVQYTGKDKELVYVDTARLLTEYKGMIDVQKSIDEKNKTYRARIDTLGSELQQQMKKYEEERASLSSNEVRLSEEVLRSKQQQFEQYRQAMEQKAAEGAQQLQSKVLAAANDYIKGYAQKKRYKIILAASSNGNILYAEEALDVTGEVIRGLNENYTPQPKEQ
jgi:outer membrane protein